MASESHGGGVGRSIAPFAGCRSQPDAKPPGCSLPLGACVPAAPDYVADALSLLVRATAARSTSGCAVESNPPAGRWVGDFRPVGSIPTSPAHIVARRPAIEYWFGSDNSSTSPVPSP